LDKFIKPLPLLYERDYNRIVNESTCRLLNNNAMRLLGVCGTVDAAEQWNSLPTSIRRKCDEENWLDTVFCFDPERPGPFRL
jgi:hypothetical protein